jgi:hypothetical protein
MAELKMPKLLWFIVCERVLEDPVSKVITLVDVIEAVTIRGAPMSVDLTKNHVIVPIRLAAVSLWTRTPDAPATFEARAVVRTPDGREFGTPAATITWGAHANFRQTIRFGTLPFVGAGRYAIVVQSKVASDDWKTAAELPVELKYEAVTEDKAEQGRVATESAPKKRKRTAAKRKAALRSDSTG